MNGWSFQKSRPTVGILINQFEGKYQTQLWKGIHQAAIESDSNCLFFSGRAIQSSAQDEDRHNLIYEMARSSKLDGLIVASASLGNYTGKTEFLKFIEPFRFMPLVSISLDLDDAPSILINNSTGMSQIITHMLNVHQYKDIAFIRGPLTNTEAEERFQIYKNELENHGITYRPEFVFEGDFCYPSGRQAVREFLDIRKIMPQAIIVSNDDMAIAVLHELKERGLRVPKDIAVTGFDDIEEMRTFYPSITTVRQPIFEQGKKAMETILDLLHGKKTPPRVVLSTHMIVRDSCGCYSRSFHNNTAQPSHQNSVNTVTPTEISDLKAYIESVKPPLLENILSTLDITQEELPVFRAEINLFLDSLIPSVNGSFQHEAVILGLEAILSRVQLDEYYFQWLKVILAIQRFIRAGVKVSSVISGLEDLLSLCHNTIYQIIVHHESSRRQYMSEQTWHLRRTIRKINSALNIDRLMDSITEELPLLGMKRCFISLFEMKSPDTVTEQDIVRKLSEMTDQIPEQSRLAMVVQNDRFIFDRKSPVIFSSRHILPEKVIREDVRYSLLFQPLFNRDINFGMIAFDVDENFNLVYETLREQISNACQSSFLFRTREIAEKKLEMTVYNLQKSEERFKETANLLPTTIIETNIGLQASFINKAGLLTFGLTEEEAAKKPNLIELVHQSDRQRFQDFYLKVMQDDDLNFNKFQFVRTDGVEIQLICKAQPIYRHKTVEGLRWSIIDIKPLLQSFMLPDDTFYKKHKITTREKDVFLLIMEGYTAREIGEKLTITEGTVKDHTKSIYSKIGVRTKSELFSKLQEFQIGHFGHQSYIFTVMSQIIRD